MIGPSSEPSPPRTSPQRRTSPFGGLAGLASLLPKTPPAEKFCFLPFKQSCYLENVAHWCLFSKRATSSLCQGLGNTKSGDRKIIRKDCDANQLCRPQYQRVPKTSPLQGAELSPGRCVFAWEEPEHLFCVFSDLSRSSVFPGGLRYKQETGVCFLLCLF